MLFNKRSPYSSPEWLTIPFLGMQKDPHQALVDIELMISQCMACLGIEGSLRVVFETPIPFDVDVTPGKELTCKLLADLDDWGTKHSHLMKPSIASDTISSSGSSSEPARESSPKATSSSASGILIRLNYMANGLILNMLMYKMQTESTAPSVSHEKNSTHYFSKSQMYSQAIIQSVSEIEKAQTPGFDMLRSITPLVTVVYCAPTIELRNTAKMMISRLTSRFGGIMSALDHM